MTREQTTINALLAHEKALEQDTVSKESYDHEYFLRKELDLKVARSEKYIAAQEKLIDKLRTEIKALSPEPTAYDVVDGNPIKDAVWETLADVLKIIDNHKIEQRSSEIPTSSIHCQHTDAEIAKSFIEDVESVKDQLPGGDQMDFPNTFDEFAKDYGFKDKDEVYTNGSELIPVFRVKQWLEHISTTKNNLAVDAISRQAVIDELKRYFHDEYYQRTSIQDCRDCFIEDVLNHLPLVTPQEPTTKNNLAVRKFEESEDKE